MVSLVTVVAVDRVVGAGVGIHLTASRMGVLNWSVAERPPIFAGILLQSVTGANVLVMWSAVSDFFSFNLGRDS